MRGNQARVKNADVRHPSSTVVMHRRKSASPVHNVLRYVSLHVWVLQYLDSVTLVMISGLPFVRATYITAAKHMLKTSSFSITLSERVLSGWVVAAGHLPRNLRACACVVFLAETISRSVNSSGF